ncbi:KIR protein [Plasmodium coatneyi]|uniref:KIR protein n=1 Tax=Plasmodium coatneyi TaxID=208452 RepID=A0A1B1DWD7_9APIC|nr:KIR protein [Plasmodium coatneyi]ANQ07103.1 KIR protein [Plasmodium coatneyi]
MVELPSQKVYAEFVKGKRGCTLKSGQGRREEVERDLKFVLVNACKINDSTLANRVVQNYCYACNGSRVDTLSDSERCNFLFYWLGDVIIREKKNDNYSFEIAMKAIYNNFPYSKFQDGCTNLYPQISKDLFEKIKVLFDFNYNYKILKKQAGNCDHATCKKLADELRDASSAYDSISGVCDEEPTNSYCTKFLAEKGEVEGEFAQPKESKCSEAKETIQTQVKLTNEHLERLDSNLLYYRRFTEDLEYCDTSCFPSRKKIADQLKEYFINEQYANLIARLLCKISALLEEGQADSKICTFFNYWLQHILSDKLNGDTSFSTLVEAINKELSGIEHKNKCELTDIDTNNIPFHRRKVLLEYSVDYDRINSDLTRFGSPKPSCSKKYHKHLQAIVDAYKAAYSPCHRESSTNCDDFKEVFKKNDNRDTLTLECQPLSDKEESALGEKDDENDLRTLLSKGGGELPPDDQTERCTEMMSGGTTTSGENTTAAPILSSVFGTLIGVPAFVFLLYKYNSLFSGILNNFGGSNKNRRKRTAAVESDFDDTLTNDGTDTSTLYSTITDDSTIYNEQPPDRRGAGNNNARQKRNVAYQRM